MNDDNIIKKKKLERKTVSVAVNPYLYKRLAHLKSTLKDIDLNRSIEKQILNIVEKLEKDYNIDINAWRELPICPLCKSKLEVKNGKYGEFLSCSSLECKFTKSISNKKEKI